MDYIHISDIDIDIDNSAPSTVGAQYELLFTKIPKMTIGFSALQTSVPNSSLQNVFKHPLSIVKAL